MVYFRFAQKIKATLEAIFYDYFLFQCCLEAEVVIQIGEDGDAVQGWDTWWGCRKTEISKM